MKLAEGDRVAEEGTTIMIRNIPRSYTQDVLLLEVREFLGLSLLFDFFYLPWDAQHGCNAGYCFINFESPAFAQQAMQEFVRYRFKLHCGDRFGAASWARVQGLENNLKRLRVRAMVCGNCSPVVMCKGEKVSFDSLVEKVRVQEALRKFEALQSPPAASTTGVSQAPVSRVGGGAGSVETEKYHNSSVNRAYTMRLPDRCMPGAEFPGTGRLVMRDAGMYTNSAQVEIPAASSPETHEIPRPFIAEQGKGSSGKPGLDLQGIRESALTRGQFSGESPMQYTIPGSHSAWHNADRGSENARQTVQSSSWISGDCNLESSPTRFPGSSALPARPPGLFSSSAGASMVMATGKSTSDYGVSVLRPSIAPMQTKDADQKLLEDFMKKFPESTDIA
eukprot:TRINITY_DN38170_c0_g1_i1.p1 TRINITY_DN38170_c0_g1~~TRINITY_DN38170_c0_g1_i1.p1  ORF type:complete len:444 (+),score=71.18 TRINITY_DN38170_c0_g1_i1:157-1332(+)